MSRYRMYPSVEQAGYRHHGQRVPGYAEQDRQLTEARAACEWLGEGSSTVQQQALRDYQQALRNWWGGTHQRPTWRKHGFRRTRPVPEARSYRVRRDAAGRWHIAFAHVPTAVAGRQSQAAFRCTACGFACHADVNAALNIAAGRAVTAWGASPWGGAVNREPQHVTSSVG